MTIKNHRVFALTLTLIGLLNQFGMAQSNWEPTAVIDCEQPCVLTRPAVVFSADYLYWQPTSHGNDFAITDQGGPATINSGQVHRVGLDRDSGFRTNLAYQTKTGWSVGIGYTYFDAFGESLVERPAGSGQLFATQSHPSTNEEADSATAQMSLDYSVFDLVVSKSVLSQRFGETRLFGGVRWAEIEQRRSFLYDGRDFTNGVVDRNAQTSGAGIRIGAASDWLLAKGFHLHGQLSGGVLFGQVTSQLDETNVNGSVNVIDVVDNRDTSLPFLNATLGLGWQSQSFAVLVGYELENWMGLEDRSMFVDHQREAAYATISEDLLLSGLFVRATFRR